MLNDISLEIHGETLHLLPERAVFWPRTGTLLIADLHLGKTTTFRHAAIAVPEGTTESDLSRLTLALNRTQARRLIILGDLIHARVGITPGLVTIVADWRKSHAGIEMGLIRGNHDHGSGDPPPSWGITCHDDPLSEPPFWLRHIPEPIDGGYTLAGHIHPAVRLRGSGRDRLTLQCFSFGREVAILPAFTSFSGKGVIEPTRGDRVYVIADDEVIAVG